MHDPWSNRSKNESYWIFRILQRAEQIANMYACSSIIQFSWIIKLYFSIKSDWVSCCSWDFLASHQTCRQDCSSSLSLRLLPAIFQSQFFCCIGPLVPDHPSYLDQSATKKKTGQDKLGPHHVHNPSRGMSNWFLLFLKDQEGQRLCFLQLTPFCVFQRNKRQKSRTGFQLLDHGASDRMHRLPDAVMRWSAKSFCKDSLKCEKKGQWHLHTSSQSPLQMFFQGARARAWWNCYGNRADIIYLFIYLFMHARI